MTPLQIMDDEIRDRLAALAHFRQAFHDALFNQNVSKVTLSDGTEYVFPKDTSVRSAKTLVHRAIEEIRHLRRIKERMQRCAKFTRTRRNQTWTH